MDEVIEKNKWFKIVIIIIKKSFEKEISIIVLYYEYR